MVRLLKARGKGKTLGGLAGAENTKNPKTLFYEGES